MLIYFSVRFIFRPFFDPKCHSDICTKGHACKKVRNGLGEGVLEKRRVGEKSEIGGEGKTQQALRHAPRKHFSSLAAIKKTEPGTRPPPFPRHFPLFLAQSFPPSGQPETDHN